MPDSSPNPQRPDGDRRDFFRQVLLGGINQVEKSTRKLGKRFERLAGEAPSAGAYAAPADGPPKVFLRPPGALPEAELAGVCSRCGDCAKACPANCIVVDPGRAGGLPHIIARQSPCVICIDLSCMKACPTGALKLVPSGNDIRMGLAVVDPQTCLRSQRVDARGQALPAEDCRVCVVQCPIGQTALAIDDAGALQVRPGCTGCGVCERACPTEPASIIIQPRTP